jgi:hypothetical protein
MADLKDIPADKREELIGELMIEVADMSSKELAFLLLDAMSTDEALERASECESDGQARH